MNTRTFLSSIFFSMAILTEGSIPIIGVEGNIFQRLSIAMLVAVLHATTSAATSCSIINLAHSNHELLRLYELINKRFDNRISKYNNFEKIWDMAVDVVMVTTGIKV